MKRFSSEFHLISTFFIILATLLGCAQSRIASPDTPTCNDETETCTDDLGLTVDSMLSSDVDAAHTQNLDMSILIDMQTTLKPDTEVVATVDMSITEDADADADADAETEMDAAESTDAQQATCQDSDCADVNNGSTACVNDRCETTCDEGFSSQGAQCVDTDECALNNGNCGAESHYICENLVGQAPRCTPRFGTNRVLFIGLDGTRASVMDHPSVLTPNIDFLKTQGIYSDQVQTGDVSVSGPGWSNNLTGVWRDKHNVSNNTVSSNRYGSPPFVNGSDYPDFIARLESLNPNYVTGWINSWDQLELMAGRNAADHHFYQQYRVNDDFDSVEQGKNMLTNFDMHALFFYFAMIDIAGHRHGFHRTVNEYVLAIELVDRQIGELLDALHSRPNYEQENWLIVVTTDHGGSSGSVTSHGENAPYDRRGFVLLNGMQAVTRTAQGGMIYPHPHQVDVAPSIYEHLGIDVDPDWGLDGQSILTEGRRVPAAFNTNLIENADGEFERGFVGMGFDGPITGWSENYGGVLIEYDSPSYPLASMHPSGGANLFSGGTDKSSSMHQTIDVSHLSLSENSQYELSADIGGYTSQGDDATINVRFLNNDQSAVIKWDNDTAYFFLGQQYQRYDIDADSAVGVSQDIAADWPGLTRFEGGAGNIEAAFNNGAGKAYFFKGDEYIRYTISSRTVDSGYPRSIRSNWRGLDGFEGGAQHIDAAFSNGDVVYFFKGKEYIRFDLDNDETDARYPRDISHATWEGIHVWSGHLDAALRWSSNRVQFFKEGAYIRYDMGLDRASDGYPRLVSRSTWPNLSAWEARRRLVALGPVTAEERNNETKLLSKMTTGLIPENTTSIEVELLFTVDVGQSDGYLDNLNLTLTQ